MPVDEQSSHSGDVDACELLSLPEYSDERGRLTWIEGKDHVPFDVKRVYYLYEVPSGEVRGEHAHHDLEQVIIPINGSFDVLLDDGTSKKQFTLDDPTKGLYIVPKIWRVLENFSSGSVGLVLASQPYDADDYIHDYESFRELTTQS